MFNIVCYIIEHVRMGWFRLWALVLPIPLESRNTIFLIQDHRIRTSSHHIVKSHVNSFVIHLYW